MSGNKTDNGVHEVGTDDIRLTYQHDTPGQDVENYIKEQEKAFHEEKNRSKKHFSQVFGNPLQGYPHNEEFEVKEIKEGYFMKEFEDGQYIKGDEKMYVDIIKKGGGKNIKVYAPDRRDPQLSIEFDGGNLKKMQKELSKKGDGTEAIEESSVKENQEIFENEAGLKKKAEKSGISLGILKQVYNRGLAAYKTGHRPGATAPQWAMARVNSFITKGKGTWGKADSDLADKVRGSKK